MVSLFDTAADVELRRTSGTSACGGVAPAGNGGVAFSLGFGEDASERVDKARADRPAVGARPSGPTSSGRAEGDDMAGPKLDRRVRA